MFLNKKRKKEEEESDQTNKKIKINLVLKNCLALIFSYCSLLDIKNIALTCSLWNNVLKSKIFISLRLQKYTEEISKIYNIKDYIDFNNFEIDLKKNFEPKLKSIKKEDCFDEYYIYDTAYFTTHYIKNKGLNYFEIKSFGAFEQTLALTFDENSYFIRKIEKKKQTIYFVDKNLFEIKDIIKNLFYPIKQFFNEKSYSFLIVDDKNNKIENYICYDSYVERKYFENKIMIKKVKLYVGGKFEMSFYRNNIRYKKIITDKNEFCMEYIEKEQILNFDFYKNQSKNLKFSIKKQTNKLVNVTSCFTFDENLYIYFEGKNKGEKNLGMFLIIKDNYRILAEFFCYKKKFFALNFVSCLKDEKKEIIMHYTSKNYLYLCLNESWIRFKIYD